MTLPPRVQTERWYTKRELARELRTSRKTIERLGLPHMRVGGQNRYLMSEVRRELERRKTGKPTGEGKVVELRPEVAA